MTLITFWIVAKYIAFAILVMFCSYRGFRHGQQEGASNRNSGKVWPVIFLIGYGLAFFTTALSQNSFLMLPLSYVFAKNLALAEELQVFAPIYAFRDLLYAKTGKFFSEKGNTKEKPKAISIIERRRDWITIYEIMFGLGVVGALLLITGIIILLVVG